MQSSLKSDSHLDHKFLARGASLLAHNLGHKNTDVFRASLLALLEGREHPLSPTQIGMVEDVLTSPLGTRALSELKHVKYCDFEQQREAHENAVADLIKIAADDYTTDPQKTSHTIGALLREGENGPTPPENFTAQKIWNSLMGKQKIALHAHRVRQFLANIQCNKSRNLDTFFDGESLHFDPQNLLLGVLNKTGDALLGNNIVHGLTPTGKPGHIFSQHGERYIVCLDQQGRHSILNYSDRNMFWTFGLNSDIPPKFLEVIPAEHILETRELQTYTGEPLFFAHVKKSYGDEYVLAHTLNRMPQIGVGSLTVMNIEDDCVLIHDNGSSASFAGTKIASLKTGQELEVRNSRAVLKIGSDDGLICFDEATWLKFEGETPDGKEFTEKIGGWFGKHEVQLSQLVDVWKKVALKEAGRI